jgi:cytochrome P450
MSDLAELRRNAFEAYAKLAKDSVLPAVVPDEPFDLARALKAVPESHANDARAIEAYLSEVGFPAFERDVSRFGSEYGLQNPSARANLLAKAMGGKEHPRTGAVALDPKAIHQPFQEKDDPGLKPVVVDVRPFTELPSFAAAALVFSGEKGRRLDFPPPIASVVDAIDAWDHHAVGVFENVASLSLPSRVEHVGIIIADAIRLVRTVNSKAIDDWLAAPSTPAEAKQEFEKWRKACFARTDALSCLVSEALLSSSWRMLDHQPIRALVADTRKLAALMGSKSYLWGSLGVAVGLSRVFVRERQFLGGVLGRQLRMNGLSFSRLRDRALHARLNEAAEKHLICPRHSEELRSAYAALAEHGVTGPKADALVVEALKYGDRGSGKPWIGLVRLTELIVHSKVDPSLPEFPQIFHDSMTAPVHYTHAPGKEWVVRDYVFGKTLLQADGKIAAGESEADLQQGRGSLIPGLLRAGAMKTEVGRHFFRPLGAFLDSVVVAEGADHQRQRKAFLPFFTQRAVLDQAAFVEETTTKLLDEAESVARRNGGAFDFKKDFAYHFPIQIICRVLDIPAEDVAKVQKWAEDSVRAMDTEAGITLEISKSGQRSAHEFRAYLKQRLDDARAGKPAGRMISAIAHDNTLTEDERIANLGVMIFAGFETTTGLLSKGLNLLLEHREQWEHLKASLVTGPEIEVDGARVPDRDLRWLSWAQNQRRDVDEARRDALSALVAKSAPLRERLEAIRIQEAALDAAVEEMLRCTAPGTAVPLTASKDLEIEVPSAMVVQGRKLEAGDKIRVRKGETISVAIDELNRRCPFGGGRFDTGARGDFDVTRTDNTAHLSFGVRHMCIGAFLAKENAKRALEGVLRRFPDLVLNGDPVPQDMELFSGLASLPVRVPERDAF